MPRTPSHTRPGSSRRLAATVLAVLLGVLTGGVVTGSPASAHTALVSSSPADGAALDTPPSAVRLRFTEAPTTTPQPEVAVTLQGQVVPAAGPVRVEDSTLVVPVDLPGTGRYTVAYRVVSPDGHPVQGTVEFTVADRAGGAAAASASPSATASPSAAASPTRPVPPPKDTSRWPYLVIGLVVLILVGIGAVLLTAPKTPKPPRN